MIVTALKAAGDGWCSTPVQIRALLFCREEEEGSYTALLAWTLAFLCAMVGTGKKTYPWMLMETAGMSLSPQQWLGTTHHWAGRFWLLHLPLLWVLMVRGVGRRQPGFGDQGRIRGHCQKQSLGGKPVHIHPLHGWTLLPRWSSGQCCYRDQQSHHCTLGTCFPERWTRMTMCVGHLNIGQCSSIFLLKSQEREALALPWCPLSNILPPFTKHPFLHLQPGTMSQGALGRQLLQTAMCSCCLQNPGGSLASLEPLQGAQPALTADLRGNTGGIRASSVLSFLSPIDIRPKVIFLC